ncbi:MAG: hypothetical protein ACREU8_10450, partial [Gammaproteobacteria bacterium]
MQLVTTHLGLMDDGVASVKGDDCEPPVCAIRTPLVIQVGRWSHDAQHLFPGQSTFAGSSGYGSNRESLRKPRMPVTVQQQTNSADLQELRHVGPVRKRFDGLDRRARRTVMAQGYAEGPLVLETRFCQEFKGRRPRRFGIGAVDRSGAIEKVEPEPQMTEAIVDPTQI